VRSAAARRASAAALLVVTLTAVALLAPGSALGEQTQRGNLIVRLDGGLSPRKLPRDRPGPLQVHLEGGLRTADGSLLPRVTRIELGLPGQAVITTRGLPSCPPRSLRFTRRAEALAACRSAMVGSGSLEARVALPRQAPFTTRAGLLAFNARVHGHRAIVVHAAAANPPSVAVLTFVFHRGRGRFGTKLVADLAAALGPWPRFAQFKLTLGRRYSFRGRGHSYLSASCPAPPRGTAGFFSLARSTYTLAGGGQISQSITRGCRAA
jgi:hypothetical protein